MPIFSIWILFEDRTEQQYRTGTTVLIDDLVGLISCFISNLSFSSYILWLCINGFSASPMLWPPYHSGHSFLSYHFFLGVQLCCMGSASLLFYFPPSPSSNPPNKERPAEPWNSQPTTRTGATHRLFQFSIFLKQNWKWNLIQIPLECLSRS